MKTAPITEAAVTVGAHATALLGDIGGTNARFTLLAGGRLGDVTTLATADHPSVAHAIRQVLDASDAKPQQAVLSVAGPVSGSRAQLTNAAWSFDADALCRDLGLDRVQVVNDFLALAHSLPSLTEEELLTIGPSLQAGDGPMAVIGPGTGFGAAIYLAAEDGHGRVIPTESGHATLAAGNDLEAEVLTHLRGSLGHVAVEDVVSGPGLERLDRALAKISGEDRAARSAADIVAAAENGEDHASHTLEVFFALLGSVAGNIALTTGTTGGVYLAGGILPRLAERLAASVFRARFEAKGRMSTYLEAIPTWLIAAPHPAFKGLARLASQT